jgi:hypothetical protein
MLKQLAAMISLARDRERLLQLAHELEQQAAGLEGPPSPAIRRPLPQPPYVSRTTIIQHLRQAEEHVRLGQKHLTNQRRIVTELGGAGHDAAAALKVLATIEAMYAVHVADRNRRRIELKLLRSRK